MQKTIETKKNCKYCCAAKEYHSNEICNLGNALKILPRVVVFKKCLTVYNTYKSNVTIINEGLHKCHLVVTTDSSDTRASVCPEELQNNFLQPLQSLQISILLKPKTKLDINRRRYIFITSQHPNVTFSVPIIVHAKTNDEDPDISLPRCITFPSVNVENVSYYKMIVYNKSSKKLQFSIKCPFSYLTVHTKSFNIMRKDYAEILLKLFCKEIKNIEESLQFKFSTGEKVDIAFRHEPLQWSLYINAINIDLGCVRFGHRKTKEFSICNDSNKHIKFGIDFIVPEEIKIYNYEEKNPTKRPWYENSSKEIINSKQNKNYLSHKHFAFEPKCGTVCKNSSYSVRIHFSPVMHDDFLPSGNESSPFIITAGVSISYENEIKKEIGQIYLKGEIIGPQIEICPEILNINDVYFGEEQIAEITVKNNDDLHDALVNLCDVSNLPNAQIIVTPNEGLTLKPNQKDIFRLQFYITIIGSFLINLVFKVKHGAKRVFIIKGCSKKVRVKCFPETVNLGVIPIAIPQKRFVILMNPLTQAITVQCSIKDEGNEIPLILNVHNTQEHLPITVKDPFYYLQQSYEYNQDNNSEYRQEIDEFQISFNNDEEQKDTSLLSAYSHTDDDNISCSTEFERLALDLIPDMSCHLVSHLKTLNILDEPEMEKTVIDETLTALLKMPYFCDMDKYKNYTQMDWNSLATDPQEIYCNSEIIYLKPRAGKVISIVVIPNVLGNHLKCIELRVCPRILASDILEGKVEASSNFSRIVETDLMTSKLLIEYDCSAPEIKWDDIFVMTQAVYAGETYDFQMVFQNTSQIGGFFYYDVIPQSNLGTMRFPNNIWKYFIEPDSNIHVPCQVKFSKLGAVNLYGCIKIVGKYASYPFHIKAEVLSPRVNIIPETICKNLAVLETSKSYIFIENATPTSTWFKIKLRDESLMSFEPCGGQLGPNAQTTYCSLTARFQDPGVYKNVLYIILECETVEKIPITINVKGIPISFEPEIRNQDLHLGNILCDNEDNQSDYKNVFSKVIRVINKGLRSYRVSVTRTKSSSNPTCTTTSSKTRVFIKPNNLIIPAVSETNFVIELSSIERTSFYSEFRVQLIDRNDVQHMESYRFTISAEFICPELCWNRREIKMSYQRIHNSNEPEQWEIIKLTNITETSVEKVNLKISGPFKMKELFEHKYAKELNFSMEGLETKEFFIRLQKELFRRRCNKLYEGYIMCIANLIVQKSVRLKLLVLIPEITLINHQITLFVNEDEGQMYIELTNSGEIPAIYKWKKLKEEWHYISQEDDVKQVASIILSDLLRMLELQTIDPELDSETNMTRRYQKYKCLLKDLNDPINIKEVIYDIINNLDLKAKCYKLSYQVPMTMADYYEKVSKLQRHDTDNRQSKISQADIVLQFENSQQSDEEKFINSTNNFEKSKILFCNHNFQSISSYPNLVHEEQSSEKENCVYYALDDILDHLKLEDSYDILSVPSSETCDLKYSVYFLEKFGLMEVNKREMCALHIPPIRKGFEVHAVFQIEVVGGESQQFEITLVNLDKTIAIKNQYIYLGLKPWYERYRTTSHIENLTNYQLSLKLLKISKNFDSKLPKIALGFSNILGNKTIQLSPFQNTVIKTEGVMGFTEDFKSKISVIVNESRENVLEINGHSTMPMLTMVQPGLPLLDQHPDEICEEYQLLQKIYYFEIFKTITDQEEEEDNLNAVPEDENGPQEVQSFLNDFTIKNGSENTKATFPTKRDRNFLKLMQTYVFVIHNEELPNYKVLDQLLETEKFLNRLRSNSEISDLLSLLHQNYLQNLKTYNEQTLRNLKHFNVQSLPFHLKTYVLNMGKVYMNQFCKFTIMLEFYGPGKLIAAARTAIKIPGLFVDFLVCDENSANKKFNYYCSEDKILNSCNIKYLNITERYQDNETQPKLRHAHSYDFDKNRQHQRIIPLADSKCLREYYKSLNKSIYSERKHHFSHCKIAGNSKDLYTTKINVIILFRPQKTYFEHNQNVEDYLFIDLHMGTTLPILMRAKIIDPKRKQNF